MTRYWMTGCMALILLVAGRWPQHEEQENGDLRDRTRISLTSKYDLDETIRQIERSVRRNGLPVLAQTALKPRSGADDGGREARVLVLGDESGHTPVLQVDGKGTPELPWKVLVQRRADGRTDVWLTDTRSIHPPEGVSSRTVETVATLPALVKAAIT